MHEHRSRILCNIIFDVYLLFCSIFDDDGDADAVAAADIDCSAVVVLCTPRSPYATHFISMRLQLLQAQGKRITIGFSSSIYVFSIP